MSKCLESVSVIIPTLRQRLPNARATLRALSVLHEERIVEVILVVNGADIDDDDDVRIFGQDFKFDVQIVSSALGANRARNKGLSLATGHFVAFTDDDIRPDDDWLGPQIEALSAPKVAAAGGPIVPLDPEKLSQVPKNLISALSIVEPPARDTVLSPHQYLYGANMVFRKNLLEKAGGFDENLGRIGTTLLSNDEKRPQLRLRQMGYEIVLTSHGSVRHDIPDSRLTVEWFQKRFAWQGVSDALEEMTGAPQRSPTSSTAPIAYIQVDASRIAQRTRDLLIKGVDSTGQPSHQSPAARKRIDESRPATVLASGDEEMVIVEPFGPHRLLARAIGGSTAHRIDGAYTYRNAVRVLPIFLRKAMEIRANSDLPIVLGSAELLFDAVKKGIISARDLPRNLYAFSHRVSRLLELDEATSEVASRLQGVFVFTEDDASYALRRLPCPVWPVTHPQIYPVMRRSKSSQSSKLLATIGDFRSVSPRELGIIETLLEENPHLRVSLVGTAGKSFWRAAKALAGDYGERLQIGGLMNSRKFGMSNEVFINDQLSLAAAGLILAREEPRFSSQFMLFSSRQIPTMSVDSDLHVNFVREFSLGETFHRDQRLGLSEKVWSLIKDDPSLRDFDGFHKRTSPLQTRAEVVRALQSTRGDSA